MPSLSISWSINGLRLFNPNFKEKVVVSIVIFHVKDRRRIWCLFLLSVICLLGSNHTAHAQFTIPCETIPFVVTADVDNGEGFPIFIQPHIAYPSDPTGVLARTTVRGPGTGSIVGYTTGGVIDTIEIKVPCEGSPSGQLVLPVFYDNVSRSVTYCCPPAGIGTRAICYDITIEYDEYGCPRFTIRVRN